MINHIRWSLLAGSVMVQGLLAIFDTPYTNSAAVSFSQHQPCGTQSVSSYTSPQAWGAPVYNPLAATVQANEWSCAANQEVHTTAQAESNDHRFFKTIRALQLQGDYRALQKMKRMLIRRQQSWRDAFAFRWAAYQERKRQLRQLKKLMADPTTQLLCKLKDTDIATAIQLVQSLQQESATHKAIGADQVDHGLSVEEKIRAAMQIIRARSDYESYLKAEEINRRLEHEKRRCVHNRVVEALTQETECGLLADRLGVLSQEVFLRAQHHNYEVAPDVQERVGISIDTIRTTQQAHVVVFHVAVVDRVLGDIQIQSSGEHNQTKTVLERSPQLLARAAEKFVAGLNPIKQVRGMCEFLVHTAYFACDITVGKLYLSHNEYNTRIKGFWDTIDALSPENLAQLSAEHWIDIAADLAGGLVMGAGVYKTVTYLKEIEATSRAARQAAKIAGTLKAAIDTALAESPVAVTAGGMLLRMHDTIEKVEDKIVQVIRNGDELVSRGKELSFQVIARTDKILELIKQPLVDLLKSGNSIREVGRDVLDISHMFSPKHIDAGILSMGKTPEEVVLESIELIKRADILKLLQEGTNNIQTFMNGHSFEIRVNVHQGVLRSFNAFSGHSTRVVKNLIKFF